MMKSHRFNRRVRGVSLIEVLVALLLFSFGVLGFVGLQARATSYSMDAEDRARAALLADELVSEMWMAGTAALPEATITAWTDKVKDTSNSGLTVPEDADPTVVTDASGVTTITISWKAPYKDSAAPLSQLVTSVSIQ